MTYVRQARLDKNKRLILLIFIVIFLFSLLFVYFFIDKDSKVKKEGQNDNAVAEQSVLNVVRASRNIQAGRCIKVRGNSSPKRSCTCRCC